MAGRHVLLAVFPSQEIVMSPFMRCRPAFRRAVLPTLVAAAVAACWSVPGREAGGDGGSSASHLVITAGDSSIGAGSHVVIRYATRRTAHGIDRTRIQIGRRIVGSSWRYR